jgi:hypothetical protein
MATDCKKPKDVKSLKIERIFESSRLSGELMACAYESLFSVSRQSLNSAPPWKSQDKLRGQNTEEKRQCMITRTG